MKLARYPFNQPGVVTSNLEPVRPYQPAKFNVDTKTNASQVRVHAAYESESASECVGLST